MPEFTKTKASEFVAKSSKLQYMCGLSYVWVDDWKSNSFIYFNRIANVLIFIFILSDFVSFFTQNDNLSEKQAFDQIVFAFSHPILMSYSLNFIYYKENIKKLLFTLTVTLKTKYNDLVIEKEMIKKAKIYSTAYVVTVSIALLFYAFDGAMQIIKTDGTFTTVIIAWPDVKEKSLLADATRIIAYLVWWIFMMRVSAVYFLVISLTIILSHQYRNLQSYFYNLKDIFETDIVPVNIKEKDYENGLKVGISLHSETLWCVKECQKICSWVFSGQITVNLTVFCILMLQMVNSDRTLMNALAIVSTSVALLLSTGFFICNAGDITIEAAALSTSIFFSGWQHCSGGSSRRVRKLVAIAIAQSQKPVVIFSFKILELSYQSYVSIIKSSYSIFSILY